MNTPFKRTVGFISSDPLFKGEHARCPCLKGTLAFQFKADNYQLWFLCISETYGHMQQRQRWKLSEFDTFLDKENDDIILVVAQIHG